MDLSFNYTHDNHFKFGYFDSDMEKACWFWDPPGSEDMDWVVDFGTCEYEPTNFKDECYRAARLITDSSDEIPNIMFSGGNESEIVVRAFLDQELPFKISILKFKKDLNLHDIAFAVTFCEQRSLSYDIVELDIKHFFEHEVYEYANRTHCPSPQLPPTMWLADQIDGLPILGSGEPYVAKVTPDGYIPGESPYEPSEWRFREKEWIQAWYRHFFQQDRPAIPGFFQYTPELMYMFLTDRVVHNLVANERVGKLSTVSTKGEIYRHWFTDMIPRPKFHGFEKVMEWDAVIREVLVANYGLYRREAECEYHKFVQELWSD